MSRVGLLGRVVIIGMILLGTGFGLSANPFLTQTEAVGPPAPRVAHLGGGVGGVMLEWQTQVRQWSAEILNQLKGAKRLDLMLQFMALTFLYGLLHALGPGHRKVVVFSAILARESRWYHPLLAGGMSAGLHGASGVLLVLGLGLLYSGIAPLVHIDNWSLWAEGISYCALGLVAIFLFVTHLGRHDHGAGRTEDSGVPDQGRKDGGLYPVIALASFVPCPGAVMILLFSLYANETGLGILGVCSMSLGMALTIAGVGYLAFLGRKSLALSLGRRQSLLEKVARVLELAAYGFLVVFSGLMAWPFVAGLVSA